MFVKYNINPLKNRTGDCTVRAIATVMNKDWDYVYLGLCAQGFVMKEMPSDNDVWRAYLKSQNFTFHSIPDTCPDCYTVEDFCYDHPYGEYILGTGTHVIAVIDGNWYDTWNSGSESPIWYWKKEEY